MSVKRLTMVETTRLAVGAETAVVLEADLNALEAQLAEATAAREAAEAERDAALSNAKVMYEVADKAEAALVAAKEALEEARQALMAASMSGSTTIPVRQIVDAAFDRIAALDMPTGQAEGATPKTQGGV